MNSKPQSGRCRSSVREPQSCISLVELMISIAIGLIIMLALITVYVNITRSNAEMAKTNSQIENGRFAMQVLHEDLVHAGFWGGHVPQFDDLSAYSITPMLTSTPGGSLPTAAPDPCLDFADWNTEHKGNLIGIAVQAYDDVPATVKCAALLTNHQVNTDVLVVRHAAGCEATATGIDDCRAEAGKLYFQPAFCEADLSGSYAQSGTTTSITLAATASAIDGFYNNMVVRIVSGPGATQYGRVISYVGATKVATIDGTWPTAPTGDSKYVFGLGYILDTAGHNFTKRNCTSLAGKYKFISNIYYVRNFANTAGDGIPTLVRSQLDLDPSSGVIKQLAPVPLIEGIEGFKVELGVDNISDSWINIITGNQVNPATGADIAGTANPLNRYTAKIKWANDENLVSPTNRGDGMPDGAFVRCTTAAPCTEAQLTNTVAVKLYLLARARETSPGYMEDKTYYLDSARTTAFNPCVDASGTALTGSALVNCQQFKRQVFSTTVRLNNISGRRETP
jgi:Tfp pilus assembly protein PilW